MKFAIQLDSNQKIWGKIGAKTNGLYSPTVPVNTWTLITVFILHTPPPVSSYIYAYIGTNLQGKFADKIDTLISPASGDKVTIGPFSNPPVSIYNMKIFSPGAYSPEISCNISPLSSPNLK